ncbi:MULTISPECIES: hypothetical protein [Erysipelotrichaceae]|uniref:hypothetical protein n=1 Tax=Erysipelotrichaceae TaxID=128827 RepID=UPI000E4D247E|nr:hypothetical protein [Absiella sp. AM27-20]RHU07480.1 hypothetical protein DW716_07650 [Absiella sp. AM27-20]
MLIITIEGIMVFDFASIVADIYFKKVLDIDLNLFGPMIFRIIGLVLGMILTVYGVILYKRYKKS